MEYRRSDIPDELIADFQNFGQEPLNKYKDYLVVAFNMGLSSNQADQLMMASLKLFGAVNEVGLQQQSSKDDHGRPEVELDKAGASDER